MKNTLKMNSASGLTGRVIFSCLLAGLASISSYAAAPLFVFDGTTTADGWQIINDTVMGGKSRSAISAQPDGPLLFKGDVSLKNNGGFASTRSPAIKANLGSFDGVELVFIGDGNRYKCGFRTDNGFNSVAHQASFDTAAGKEQRIRIPFADFKPTWRGQQLPNTRQMDPAEIKSIGFLISDKQEGPFQLEVKSISAYREKGQDAADNGSDIISIAQAAGTFKTLLAAVDAAGLTDTVRSLEGVTLFAPTDEAFAKLPEGTIATLLEPENKEQLVNILCYHVINSEVTFSTATTLTQATALNKEELALRVKQGSLFLNDSRVIENDITTANGLIHVIDTVLIPPATDEVDIPPVERIIVSAIRRGVPLFNHGNSQACADLYELTAEALLMLPEENLDHGQRSVLEKALIHSQNEHSAKDRAWIMRIALDATLASSSD